jgi:hypothetical protein
LLTRYRGTAAADLLLLSTPKISRTISNPNKTNHYDRKKIRPTLPRIIPQKRKIKEVTQRASSMAEHIREIVPAVETQKNAIKVRKSAQKTPGNHPTTTIPSTT